MERQSLFFCGKVWMKVDEVKILYESKYILNGRRWDDSGGNTLTVVCLK